MANPTDMNIETIAHDIGNAMSHVAWQTWGAATLYILFGVMLAGFASGFVGRVLTKHTSAHYTLIIRRIIYYAIIAIAIVLSLAALNLDMKVLGIATVLTLAIGFASQTAVSNIISGLFLVFEQPFLVGDLIEYKGVTGELLSIDLLSIKVRTYDNSQVRIPNEELLKNQFVNLTKFSTRRYDIKLRFSINEDIDKIRALLLNLAKKNTLVLTKPAPKILFQEFTEAAIVMNLAVWVDTENYDALKQSLPYEMQKEFRSHEFKMPITHVMQQVEGK